MKAIEKETRLELSVTVDQIDDSVPVTFIEFADLNKYPDGERWIFQNMNVDLYQSPKKRLQQLLAHVEMCKLLINKNV